MRPLVIEADCLDAMAGMPDASVMAVVCDPPYDLTAGKRGGSGEASVNLGSPYGRARIGTGNGAGGFMGKAWDGTGVAFDPATWRHVLRVLKPGGHLLAFGGTRTYHRLACAIEDAGLEIRDTLCWLYGSGFPKSLNLDGDWQGWGTALKPAFEPVVLARKPLTGTVAGNVLEHGTGALNVDACRVATGEGWAGDSRPYDGANGFGPGDEDGWQGNWSKRSGSHDAGRWPSDVLLDETAAARLDEQSGELTSGANPTRRGPDTDRLAYGDFAGQRECVAHRGVDTGGASRFFYTAKSSSAERNAGLDGFEERTDWADELPHTRANLNTSTGRARQPRPSRNHHPTVKPIDLMRWLVRLVTPPGGIVLDPFMGSGTTGIACHLEGFRFVGVEREPEYAAIARARLEWWSRFPIGTDTDVALGAGRERDNRVGQLGMFDVPCTDGNGRVGEASAERRYTEAGASNFAMKPGRRRP